MNKNEEFAISKPTLKKILKDILKAEGENAEDEDKGKRFRKEWKAVEMVNMQSM